MKQATFNLVNEPSLAQCRRLTRPFAPGPLRQRLGGWLRHSYSKRSSSPCNSSRRAAAGVACRADAQKAAFPAGKRQAKVQLPALFVSTDVTEAQGSGEAVAAAVTAGATGVLLLDESDLGGAELYEAGVRLKEVIRGRAVLLLSDRTDIADAVEADGVALSSKGVPTLVARRMLRGSSQLVARVVGSAEEARAAATEGANLAILKGSAFTEDAVRAAKTQQGSGGGIPVVVAVKGPGDAPAALGAAADGVMLDVRGLQPREAGQQVEQALASLKGEPASSEAPSLPSQRERQSSGDSAGAASSDGLKHFLNASSEALLEAERRFLSTTLDFLQEAAPEMEEAGLLADALKQLDELFLVVVVGEFNSGKSSVINALLGSRHLAEGILPTTNEISVLKFSESRREETTQTADGFFVRRLPAELLRDINIVDTPGTNVIVDRQKRLTEEYVPRADLVLFCMSADRPFTESETAFLKYIRQWGKKVVFVVNKVDILADGGEVDEVVRFVGDSATRLLGVERSQVLPVSARKALQAKLAVGGGKMAGGILSSTDAEALSGDAAWEASRFGALERFVLDFLVGGASAGESVRLKLQTPLFVADALLEAAGERLAEDLAAAKQDVAAVKSVQDQLANFRREMARDGAAQRSECRKLIAGAVKRANGLIDSTLQLSNLDALSGYIFGSKADPGRLPIGREFADDVVGPSKAALDRLVADHGAWHAANAERQLASYRSFAAERATQLGTSLEELTAPTSNGAASPVSEADGAAAEERRRWREGRSNAQAADSASRDASDQQSPSAIVKAFDPAAGAIILEEEIRESVINTAGAALGAGVLGIVSTFVLPNTLEDLFALAIGGLVGYAALLNLPLRRNDAKEKLQRSATEFAEDLDARMEAELESALERCAADVNAFVLPLQRASEAVVSRLERLRERREGVVAELRGLQQRAANVE